MSNLIDIEPSELTYEILNDSHDLSVFDCSVKDEMGLNEFIHQEALQFQRENMGITYLFFYKKTVVGFATLAMSQIEIKETKIKLPFNTTIKDYPALMIGRLATDNNYRGRHVGENICLWCISKVKQLSAEIGCKLIVILTNEEKYAFYLNCGFDMVPKFENKPKKWMYLPVP
jgi:predicted GNAT family N-acyltransferase